LPNSGFVIDAVRVVRGAIRVTLTTTDPGRLTATASSRALRPAVYGPARVRRLAAGTFTVTLTPNALARHALNRGRRLPVSLLLTYQSAKGGAPTSRHRAVVVRLRGAQHRQTDANRR
jgi:hypothetical protein